MPASRCCGSAQSNSSVTSRLPPVLVLARTWTSWCQPLTVACRGDEPGPPGQVLSGTHLGESAWVGDRFDGAPRRGVVVFNSAATAGTQQAGGEVDYAVDNGHAV